MSHPLAAGIPAQTFKEGSARLLREPLRVDLDAFAPSRVLAVTGNWIGPFKDNLDLHLEPRAELSEGVGAFHRTAWVVAGHPMGKPGDRFVDEVTRAFAELGRPL